MARLDDITGKSLAHVRKGAYTRCFGDEELSRLLSRVQSLIIRNGHELEGLVTDLVSDKLIRDLDEFLDAQIMRLGVRVAVKREIRKAQKMQGRLIEPDFLIFERTSNSQHCYIIELKDGHEFDTKSSAKEHANLNQFVSMNAMALSNYHSFIKICGFNALTREEIQTGFKGKIALSQAMTGAEFCHLLGVDYEALVLRRALDKPTNYNQFLDDLLAIDSVHDSIIEKLLG